MTKEPSYEPIEQEISIPAPVKGVTYKSLKIGLNEIISILTPAKGVTCGRCAVKGHERISILTPARGVTGGGTVGGVPLRYFNSHPREGGDRLNGGRRLGEEISILTPARGVTPHPWPPG